MLQLHESVGKAERIDQVRDLREKARAQVHQEMVEVQHSLLRRVHGPKVSQEVIDVLSQRGGRAAMIGDETRFDFFQLIW